MVASQPKGPVQTPMHCLVERKVKVRLLQGAP